MYGLDDQDALSVIFNSESWARRNAGAFYGSSGSQAFAPSRLCSSLPPALLSIPSFYMIRLFSPEPVRIIVIDEARQLWKKGNLH